MENFFYLLTDQYLTTLQVLLEALLYRQVLIDVNNELYELIALFEFALFKHLYSLAKMVMFIKHFEAFKSRFRSVCTLEERLRTPLKRFPS